jgi:hypothetical protein
VFRLCHPQPVGRLDGDLAGRERTAASPSVTGDVVGDVVGADAEGTVVGDAVAAADGEEDVVGVGM